MSPELPETTPRCEGVIFTKISIPPQITKKPASDTVELPEPKFDEIKQLYSNTPLRFNRPKRFS